MSNISTTLALNTAKSWMVIKLIEDSHYSLSEIEFDKVFLKLKQFNIHPYELFEYFTSHIVNAYLVVGDCHRARKVFNTIPPDVIRVIGQQLKQTLEDSEEAERLYTSVYPSYVPMALRWISPRLSPDTYLDNQLKEWFPGRVSLDECSETSVIVTWVEPHTQRVFCKTFDRDHWIEFGGIIPKDENPFFLEIATYQNVENWVVTPDLSADNQIKSNSQYYFYLIGYVNGGVLNRNEITICVNEDSSMLWDLSCEKELIKKAMKFLEQKVIVKCSISELENYIDSSSRYQRFVHAVDIQLLNELSY